MMMFGVLCPFQHSSAQGLHDDVWCFMSFSIFISQGLHDDLGLFCPFQLTK